MDDAQLEREIAELKGLLAANNLLMAELLALQLKKLPDPIMGSSDFFEHLRRVLEAADQGGPEVPDPHERRMYALAAGVRHLREVQAMTDRNLRPRPAG